MFALSATVLLAGGLAAQTPDVLDIFRTDTRANVLLLLDSSGSMHATFGTLPSGCTWYASTYNGGNTHLSKNQMMKAALLGCTSAYDGILDRWSSRMNLSIWHFGGTIAGLANFGSSLTTLETAAASVAATGGTPMTMGLRAAGNYYRTYFNDSTHPSCRRNYMVIMSDGEPNGSGTTYNYQCASPVESLFVAGNEPWHGARYHYREPTLPTTVRDMLCTVSGIQPIRTFAVGFEALSSFDESTLIEIASNGDGEYYHATDATQLSASFDSILGNIAARNRVDFSAPASQITGLYSDNYAYSSYFKPTIGIWSGTVKKHCVEPRRLPNGRYDTTQTNCQFTSPDGTTLLTNPSPQDLFTYITSPAADSGGTGEVLFSMLGAGPNSAPVAPYWTRRNIVSWRDGTGYFQVMPTTISRSDTWANGCDHHRLVNYLHGYTFEADCATGNPLQIRAWPLGAPIHSSPIVLKYGRCHTTADVPVAGMCYVVQATNDGMLHFFDAADGRETSALIPGDFWKASTIAENRLSVLDDQPNTNQVQRYYLDGDVRLFHDDADGDTVIDAGETARLIFGLGRGGHAYYQLPVTRLPGGVLSTANNPIYPLTATNGTAYQELRETWHAPYVGRAVFSGTKSTIAAFGSGHVAALDAPTAVLGVQPNGLQLPINPSNVRSIACAGASSFATYNGYLSSGTNLCTVAWRPTCAGTRTNPCYDTGYWASSPAVALPLNLQFGPLRYASSTERAIAFRVQFTNFDLGSGDRLVIKDGTNEVIQTHIGTSLNGGGWTDWIYDPDNRGFYLELLTNGVDTANRGMNIANIEYVGAPINLLPPGTPAHNPTLFVLDAAKWNGHTPRIFNQSPASGAALMRVSRSCTGSDSGICLDQATVPALANLVCPITAEVSAYTEGDLVRALYFATECGEIWKTWSDDGGTNWNARRLLSLNTPGRTGSSKNFRKIFRKLDIVPSACPGRRVVGLYFGTGNEQRPQANDELTDSTLNDGRDVIGVLWDDGSINERTINHLADLTNSAPGSVNARTLWASGSRGWYIRLEANERMLRNPLVFDGVAFYKTRQPTSTTGECTGASGVDRVYAIENCTAAPIADSDGNGVKNNADRVKASSPSDVGSELFAFTPRNGPAIISAGDTQTVTQARLNPTRGRGVARFYMWRRPLRDR